MLNESRRFKWRMQIVCQSIWIYRSKYFFFFFCSCSYPFGPNVANVMLSSFLLLLLMLFWLQFDYGMVLFLSKFYLLCVVFFFLVARSWLTRSQYTDVNNCLQGYSCAKSMVWWSSIELNKQTNNEITHLQQKQTISI